MGVLPAFNLQNNITKNSPHVVILGAGASKAAFPDGDANRRLVPLMCELIDCLDLEPLLNDAGFTADYSDFEAIYDNLVSSGEHPTLVKEIEVRVREYFSQLRLPETATIYDYLVLSLREKDMIASFNWDPFLALAWQRNSHVLKLPRIVFLHGNIEVAACLKHSVKNFRTHECNKCKQPLTPTRLLFPVKHKNYNSDPFIAAEWNELCAFLKYAYFLTIFGYAAPTTDVEARELMLNVWKANPTFELAQIEIIDTKPHEELEGKWDKFFCREHYTIRREIWRSYLFWYPRRSCEAFAMATLQNAPWTYNPFPKTTDLHKLQEWAKRLWLEEETGWLTGKTCEELTSSNNSVQPTLIRPPDDPNKNG